MSEYRLKKQTFTRKMRADALEKAKSLREDYADRRKRVGKCKIQYEFQVYQKMKAERQADGWVRYTHDENGKITYELVLTITFPLSYLPFDAVDIHTYRWNERRKEFEFESTEIF